MKKKFDLTQYLIGLMVVGAFFVYMNNVGSNGPKITVTRNESGGLYVQGLAKNEAAGCGVSEGTFNQGSSLMALPYNLPVPVAFDQLATDGKSYHLVYKLSFGWDTNYHLKFVSCQIQP